MRRHRTLATHRLVMHTIVRLIAAVLVCLPVSGQCLTSPVVPSDTPQVSKIDKDSTLPMAHHHGDHAMDNQGATNATDVAEPDCCDSLTCTMPQCASVGGGHISAIALPELAKSAATFTRISTDGPTKPLASLFKPPICA